MKSREFEEMLHDVGGFGPFQIMVFVTVSLFETPAAWAMFLPVFIHRSVPWKCLNDFNNSSSDDLFLNNNSAITNAPDNISSSIINNDTCLFCEDKVFIGDFTSIVSEWNLICSHIPGWIMTAQMVGVMLGAFVIGQLADIIGRRTPYFCAYVGILIFGAATAFSVSWHMYAICRFLCGFCIGGTMVINFVLPMEFVSSKWRTFCGCIGFWAVGIMTLAPLAYFIRNWRYLTAVCSLSGFVLLFTWWFIPESPRWLLVKGRITEAEKIMKRMAKMNKTLAPQHAELVAFSKEKQDQQVKQKEGRPTYWDLFRTFEMSKNTLIVVYAWFVSSSVYYGLSLSVPRLAGNEYLNFFLSGLVEIPALLFVIGVNNALGRRVTISMLMGLAGFSCFGVFVLNICLGKASQIAVSTVLITITAMLGKSGIAGGWAAMQVYSAELFPTVARNVGIAASAMLGRIGGIVSPQIATLDKIVPFLPFAICGTLALICSLLALFLPETLNKPMPDTLPPWQYRCCGKEDTELKESFDIEEKLASNPLLCSSNGHLQPYPRESSPQISDQDVNCKTVTNSVQYDNKSDVTKM